MDRLTSMTPAVNELLLSVSGRYVLRGPGPELRYAGAGSHGRSVWRLVADRRGAATEQAGIRSCLEDVGRRSIHGVDHRRHRQLRLADRLCVTGASWYVQSLEIRASTRTSMATAVIGLVTTDDRGGWLDHPDRGRKLTFFFMQPARRRVPELKYCGAAVVAGQFGGVGADRCGAQLGRRVFEVAWKSRAPINTRCGRPTAAATTPWQTPVVTASGHSFALRAIDRDRASTRTSMATGGSARSRRTSRRSDRPPSPRSADSYFLYAHNTIIGPQLRYAGAYAAVGQFGVMGGHCRGADGERLSGSLEEWRRRSVRRVEHRQQRQLAFANWRDVGVQRDDGVARAHLPPGPQWRRGDRCRHDDGREPVDRPACFGSGSTIFSAVWRAPS